ncbi:hypothetical protein HBH56_185590 [Parastagonospora nodorum]|uniref:C2H2-type domain-containing protein n=2 Tax=Phaeosphaeria nodorum (strain SN15 / ATCC MYA-4574 / FGSC 10173) TaxID=321614 RepID=A0A7U2I2N6_PHANO|nr:hypothetical protein SNOG_15315 [Parastagonospora nodorum SN15]KAH3907629.1 hypothetical protein HBH56_185590 [Parastagonospora nodorum]EAT77248.1 hypothetical protein SNOG_15315 [Parastagonospora nodorum SN15]KAH3925251.1 hypothetical protein HBH54_182970 [Parastagonospora nodorum]KAH4127297.1 hypothetical protein HBH45_219880 [Parastagonospora nodorum]KAH4148795.1 hypothetical protein HBH44_203830 [Parastagonospora nodorum]
MSSYYAFSGTAESSGVVPTMLFELQLNIEFRKTLEGKRPCNAANTDRDSTPASLPHQCRDAKCDRSELTLPSTPCDIHPPTTSTPNTSSSSSPLSSTPSTNGTPPWSDTSCSPNSTSSAHSASTPPRSASPAPPPPPFTHTCPTCGQSFRLPGQLNKHWFSKHKRRFSCAVPACGKAFHLRADLTRHTKSRHTAYAGTRCEHAGCAETFSRRDNMMRHIREEHEHGGRKRAGSRGSFI